MVRKRLQNKINKILLFCCRLKKVKNVDRFRFKNDFHYNNFDRFIPVNHNHKKSLFYKNVFWICNLLTFEYRPHRAVGKEQPRVFLLLQQKFNNFCTVVLIGRFPPYLNSKGGRKINSEVYFLFAKTLLFVEQLSSFDQWPSLSDQWPSLSDQWPSLSAKAHSDQLLVTANLRWTAASQEIENFLSPCKNATVFCRSQQIHSVV